MLNLESTQRRIVDSLLQHRGDGMTPPELAHTLQISMTVITVQLKKLRTKGLAMKDPDRTQRDGHQTWFVDVIGIEQTSDRFKKKMRKCLGGCDRMFESEHAGNRICPKCSGKQIIDGVDEAAV